MLFTATLTVCSPRTLNLTGSGGTPVSVLCMNTCALVAYSLVSPVNTLLVISRHTVLICILTPMPGPYWTTSGLVAVAHRVRLPTELPTMISQGVKILGTHFAIRQLTLRNPSHPPTSCVAMTPHDLQNCLLRARMLLSSWTDIRMRLLHQVDLCNTKRP